MKQQLLLLSDVDSLGRKGEVVTARPGYVRNYLIPKGFAIVATRNTLRKQEQLKLEREKQAIVDRKEAEELSAQIQTIALEVTVKVDPEGHMYGSVSANDIAKLFQEQGLPVERKYILVTKPIKTTGVHPIQLKLKEGLEVACNLHIKPEGYVPKVVVAAPKPVVDESSEEAPSSDTEEESK